MISKFIVFVLLLALIAPAPAYAYVDPGSGSLIIQMLLAVCVGAMFYFRQFREKIKELFFGKDTESDEKSRGRDESVNESDKPGA